MKTILLISSTNEKVLLTIAGLVLLFGISCIVWAICSAEEYEFTEDTQEAPGSDQNN
jgi:hypothetical protein